MKLRAAALLFALFTIGCGDSKPAPLPKGQALDTLVDSIMSRLQQLAGLKKTSPIKIQLQNKDSMRLYIERRMNEEMPDSTLAGIKALYETLGLVPANFDMKKTLLDLLTEQVVGYYDPPTKTLYVITGADPTTLRPVLVHELVHALQDQHTNLDSLMKKEHGNDRQTAAQSAIEGHATMVMVAYVTEEHTKSPVNLQALPDIGAQMQAALEQQNEQFPVFQKSPRILRETLVFPYARGAGFVQRLWIGRPARKGSREPLPAPLGDKLPNSTEQIMHPDSKFLVQRDEPTDLKLLPAGTSLREDGMGELETSLFLSEHMGPSGAVKAQGWDGDRYRLLRTNDGDVLEWFSVWDDAASADRFAEAAKAIALRRGRAARVQRISIGDRPGVEIVDAPNARALNAAPSLRAEIVK